MSNCYVFDFDQTLKEMKKLQYKIKQEQLNYHETTKKEIN